MKFALLIYGPARSTQQCHLERGVQAAFEELGLDLDGPPPTNIRGSANAASVVRATRILDNPRTATNPTS